MLKITTEPDKIPVVIFGAFNCRHFRLRKIQRGRQNRRTNEEGRDDSIAASYCSRTAVTGTAVTRIVLFLDGPVRPVGVRPGVIIAPVMVPWVIAVVMAWIVVAGVVLRINGIVVGIGRVSKTETWVVAVAIAVTVAVRRITIGMR